MTILVLKFKFISDSSLIFSSILGNQTGGEWEIRELVAISTKEINMNLRKKENEYLPQLRSLLMSY